MHLNRTDTPYHLLRQSGPFATGENPPPTMPFSAAGREWCRALGEANGATTFRVVRNQILELLDIRSLAELPPLLVDRDRREQTTRRAYRLLANMFGITGNERETVARINRFSSTADDVIRSLQGKVLANYASHIEMTNEIDASRCPLELLLIIFDNRYHRKARFEAQRKLVLMQLAAAIDQRERETDMESKFSRFLAFMNEHVWSPDIKIGELETAFLLSEHAPEDFSCQSVRVIDRKEARQFQWEPGRKLTLVKRRRFRPNGHEIPIYVTIRKKTAAAKVLKLLRKGEENPAVAVDDELGLMGVVDSMQEVKLFHQHLSKSAARAGTLLTLEEVNDNLDGIGHRSGNIGSSTQTPMCKFFARMGGMRVEFILHTNKSYLDYRYRRDVAHDEYEAKRIFDSGVAELLFPPSIYHLDLPDKRREVLRQMRRNIEEF
ncbi:MAG: hypothetical protein OEV73_12710 [Desulfobulbaceae bacterium]|nr:hypothetical protein [Desulfobulbaceae bacterium]